MGCCQSRTDETEFRNSISSVILSKSQPEELTTNNEPEHEIEEIIAGDQAQEKAESNLIKFTSPKQNRTNRPRPPNERKKNKNTPCCDPKGKKKHPLL